LVAGNARKRWFVPTLVISEAAAQEDKLLVDRTA